MRAPRQAADFNHLSKVEGRDDSDCRGAPPRYSPLWDMVKHCGIWSSTVVGHVVGTMDMSGGTEIGEERDPRRRKSRRVARPACRDIGFKGVLRPDHVPTMEADSNDNPAYSALGRLFAIGNIEGLRQSAYAGI